MGFSGSHILILVLVVLLVFGASKLPNAARSLGRSMRIFKSEMDEMKTSASADDSTGPQAIEQQHAQANQPNLHANGQQADNQSEFNGR